MDSKMHLDFQDGCDASSTPSAPPSTHSQEIYLNSKESDAEIASAVRTVRFSGPTPDTSYGPSESSSVDDDLEFRAPRSTTSWGWRGGDTHVPLQIQILNILRKIPGHEEKKGFFAENELAALMTERHIAEELTLCFEDVLDSTMISRYAKSICGTAPDEVEHKSSSFKKIFAILILCDKPKSILRFMSEGVSDSKLPLVKSVPTDGGSSTLPGSIFDLSRRDREGALECFRTWSYTAVGAFEEWQWTTIAPFFHLGSRKNVKHLELQDQVALPFELDSRFPDKTHTYQRLEHEGGFSSVFKVRIHSDHHNLCAPGNHGRDFAVKCLLSRDQTEFKREVDTLIKFSGDSHDHLVSLLATYEQFGKFYLVFPWAEADLQGYWNNHRSPVLDHESVRWLAEQCTGIAEGLTKIHRYETTYIKRRTNSMGLEAHMSSVTSHHDHARANLRQLLYGRHGDIKPENILWFQDPSKKDDRGILKISDFGLTEFSIRHSQCYKLNSQVAHSLSYRPPECDLEGAVVGQSYDIWTLGCLYLELITWQLGGVQLLQEFRQRRTKQDPMRLRATDTFFEIVRCGQTNTVGSMIKPEVTDFMLDLRAHPSCTEYFHEFINLVLGEMLIIKSPNPNEKGRATIERVRNGLSELEKRLDRHDYAVNPAPWLRYKGDCKRIEEAVEVDVEELPKKLIRMDSLRTYTGRTLTRDRL